MDALRSVFLDFCSFGAGQNGSSTLDNAKFVKLCKDCGVLTGPGKKITSTDLDLIFTRAKGKTEKKIGFDQFVAAIEMVAQAKGVAFGAVASVIVTSGGPTVSGTIADDVRFHDDKSTYTGVHTSGGPTTIDRHHVQMDAQLDRSGADVRGVKEYSDSVSQRKSSVGSSSPARVPVQAHRNSSVAATSPTGAGSSRPSSSSSPPRRSSAINTAAQMSLAPTSPSREGAGGGGSRRSSAASTSAGAQAAEGGRKSSVSTSSPSRRSSAAAAATGGGGDMAELEGRMAEVFVAFAGSVVKSSTDIDSSRFFKLCNDCGLVDRKLSRTDCDLIFTKVVQKVPGAGKKMPLHAFRRMAIPMIAQQKGVSEDEVVAAINNCPGIAMSGTFADDVRFHDDKNLYTGVHAAGGPTHVDRRITLDNLADRSSADVRGVQPGRAS